jgi:glutathione-regulated potassium-efflux system ancillary protein KefG
MSVKMTYNRILILFAHPALQKSRVNRILIQAVQGLDGVTFQDLYQVYPDFHINVKHEQNLLHSHDILVFHHPFFWYSTPAILKEWKDLVLEHGWAYGRDGNALRGKKNFSVITTGGGENFYQSGQRRFTVRELLAPVEQTARLCGMDYLPPFVVHGTYQMTETAIQGHAADYRRALEAIRDDRIDLSALRSHSRLNDRLDAIILE